MQSAFASLNSFLRDESLWEIVKSQNERRKTKHRAREDRIDWFQEKRDCIKAGIGASERDYWKNTILMLP